MSSPVYNDLSFDLYSELKCLIDDEKTKIIVIHSSIINFYFPDVNIKWMLLGALKLLISDGYTLALPTFTFSFCNGRSFNQRTSLSESGILGEWLLQLNGASRTNHCIYSFVVAGPMSSEILSCDSSTTFSNDSPFGLFDKTDTAYVMLGCDWSFCTQFHYYEEEASVPYRFYKEFTGDYIFGDNQVEKTERMFVRDLNLDPVNNFDSAIKLLNSNNKISKRSFLGKSIEAVSSNNFSSVCRKLLKDDKYAFIKDNIRVRNQVDLAYKKRKNKPLRIAVLSMHNSETLIKALKESINDLMQDHEVLVYSPEFGQVYNCVYSENSTLYNFAANFIFFIDRIEDIYKVNSINQIDYNNSEPFDEYINMIMQFSESCSGNIIVNLISPYTYQIHKNIDVIKSDGARQCIERMNQRLIDLAKSVNNVMLFDFPGAQYDFPGVVADWRLWYLGKIPYSYEFTSFLAKQYASLILAATGNNARLLILDLDNTVWGGVLGEDGIENLQLGGDYPGNAYQHFQKELKHLSDKGFSICIVSKNDEKDALNAISTLSNMALGKDDIVNYRINWKPKWTNILEIADEVGISTRNILFIDDNPIEREEVRQNLPEVMILELPDDPALYTEALFNSPYIDIYELTQEDSKRTKNYISGKKILDSRKKYSNAEDFYAFIEPKLQIYSLNTVNLARTVQLINKTNQFNTTAIRYNKKELEEIHNNGNDIFVLGLEDKFSELEVIGVAVVLWNFPDEESVQLNLFLLSCRVLGRGVEQGFIAWLVNRAKEKKYSRIIGLLKHTDRNTPVQNIFLNNEFIKGEKPEEWELNIHKTNLSIPNWISITDMTGK